jgi:hypothetical protein
MWSYLKANIKRFFVLVFILFISFNSILARAIPTNFDTYNVAYHNRNLRENNNVNIINDYNKNELTNIETSNDPLYEYSNIEIYDSELFVDNSDTLNSNMNSYFSLSNNLESSTILLDSNMDSFDIPQNTETLEQSNDIHNSYELDNSDIVENSTMVSNAMNLFNNIKSYSLITLMLIVIII